MWYKTTYPFCYQTLYIIFSKVIRMWASFPIFGKGEDYDSYNPCRDEWGTILEKAPFAVSINAHTHRFAYIPEGSDGNNYPVVVGGGYRMDGATVMVLQKKGKEMTLRVLNAKGETLKELNL